MLGSKVRASSLLVGETGALPVDEDFIDDWNSVFKCLDLVGEVSFVDDVEIFLVPGRGPPASREGTLRIPGCRSPGEWSRRWMPARVSETLARDVAPGPRRCLVLGSRSEGLADPLRLERLTKALGRGLVPLCEARWVSVPVIWYDPGLPDLCMVSSSLGDCADGIGLGLDVSGPDALPHVLCRWLGTEVRSRTPDPPTQVWPCVAVSALSVAG